ncbi:MAG: FxsA family protein [Cocleimonas sp.]
MRSYSIFAVIFLVIPILEIYFLIKVSDLIEVFPTIILVILTAVIGAGLLRQQGLSTLARLQQNMGQGKIPAQEMIEGVLLAVGGALLMTPGFITDTIGFLCLIPFSRKFIAQNIMKRSADKMKAGVSAQMGGFGGFSGGSYTEQTPPDSSVVEGEFTEVEENPPVISPTDKNK